MGLLCVCLRGKTRLGSSPPVIFIFLLLLLVCFKVLFRRPALALRTSFGFCVCLFVRATTCVVRTYTSIIVFVFRLHFPSLILFRESLLTSVAFLVSGSLPSYGGGGLSLARDPVSGGGGHLEDGNCKECPEGAV